MARKWKANAECEYISRHDKAAAYLHWNIYKDHDIEVIDKWYEHKPESCIAKTANHHHTGHDTPRTGGSVGSSSGCHTGGREFDSGRTNTQGLKITEEKVLPL